MSVTVLINLAAFAALIFLLSTLERKNKSLSLKTFIGLLLGIVFGTALQMTYGNDYDGISTTIEWTNVIGDGYFGLVNMILIPFVVITMLRAVADMEKVRDLGKITLIIAVILFLTNITASFIGAGIAKIMGLSAQGLPFGDRERGTADYIVSKAANVANSEFASLVSSYIPRNIFSDFAAARPISVLAIVLFSILFAIAAKKAFMEAEGQKSTFMSFVKITELIINKLFHMILALTPYGVMAMMAKYAATANMADFILLAEFIIGVYLAVIIMFMVHASLIKSCGMDIKSYFKSVFPVLTVGATSHKTGACLPLTIATQVEKLGVSKHIAVLSSSIGVGNGQNACAGIFPTMLAIIVAPTVGIDVDFGFIITLIFVVGFTSFTIAGMGAGWVNSMLIVFPIMGLPIEMAAVLIAVDPLLDMIRSALNINGAITAGVITNRIMGNTK